MVQIDKPLRREDGGMALTESPGWWDPGSRCAAGWAAEGAQKGRWPSKLRRVGMRQLPGICRYPAECTVFVNQGGIADKEALFVLDRC